MNSVQMVPLVPGTSPLGGTLTIIGQNVPAVAAGDMLFFVGTGMTPNKSVSVYIPGQVPVAQALVGWTDANGILQAEFTATGPGNLAGMELGGDLFMHDPSTGAVIMKGSISTTQIAAFVPAVPAPPAPPPVLGIAYLAQQVVARRNAGAAGIVSYADFQGRPECSLPAIPIQFWNGGVLMSAQVGWAFALTPGTSGRAADLATNYLGASVELRTPPWPDPKSTSYVGIQPEVPWLVLPDGRSCNAGLLASTLLVNYQDEPSLEATLNSQFQQGALPAS
jgi:hypothetical protein